MLPTSVCPIWDRRRNGKRLAADSAFNFYNFNHSRLLREHQGLICNQSQAGACFQTNQRCLPGTIVFMRRSRNELSRQKSAQATRLAEIRWCTPQKDPERMGAKWSIGIRYL